MANGRNLPVLLTLSLLANAFCAPAVTYRTRRSSKDNQSESDDSTTNNSKLANDGTTTSSTSTSTTTEDSKSDEEDDDLDDQFNSPPSNSEGSNIFSLLNLANALFPSSSGTTNKIKDTVRSFLSRNNIQFAHRRHDIPDNEIEIDYPDKVPTFQRQESSEHSDDSDSETSESRSEDSDENNGAEESAEKESTEDNSNESSKQDSVSNSSNESDDSDYDEPPGGDGQGGGILGLLSGLSGQNGESDLGSLLGAVAGIVVNLSGDGIDLNALIVTALGLFVGILSEGEQNPGEVIASYLQASLDTITGGGAQNNGKFFGKFVSKLVKGVSAAGEPDDSPENTMSDSAGFLFSLIMGLIEDMAKSSFDGSSKPWR